MTKESNLISVIVPIYKVENYLKRCIDSILHQTYRNLEIILVDDGSPDNCGETCDKYKKLDNRIKVIHKINGGLSDARNVGLKVATGDYISFIDSDDWIDLNYFKILFEIATINQSDLVICNYEITSEYNLQKINHIWNSSKIINYSNLEALNQYYGRKATVFITAWGKLYKAKLLKNIEFPIGRIHEDEFIIYQLLYRSQKVTYIDIPIYYYFQREDSITGKKTHNEKGYVDYFQALDERILFYESHSLFDFAMKTKNSYCNILERALISKKSNYSNDFLLFCSNKQVELSKEICKSKNTNIKSKLREFIFKYNKPLYRVLVKYRDN